MGVWEGVLCDRRCDGGVGATLTIQPDVVGKFAHERTDEYSGVTVEGTLMADGGDSTTAILFTSGAAEWARVKLQVKV